MRLSKVARQLAELQSAFVKAGVSKQDAVLIVEYSYASYETGGGNAEAWLESLGRYIDGNQLPFLLSSGFIWFMSPERDEYWREVGRKLP